MFLLQGHGKASMRLTFGFVLFADKGEHWIILSHSILQHGVEILVVLVPSQRFGHLVHRLFDVGSLVGGLNQAFSPLIVFGLAFGLFPFFFFLFFPLGFQVFLYARSLFADDGFRVTTRLLGVQRGESLEAEAECL